MAEKCLYCGNQLRGRADKKFCSPHCKSALQYQNRKKEENLYFKIDRQLKTNRKILKSHNKSGFSTVNRKKLKREGFDPNYFTHYWKNNKGQVYLFCYEYGFLAIAKNEKKKYLLVIWQEYMENSVQ